MKKSLILAVSAVLAIAAAAFSGNANAQKTDYSTLWKSVNDNLNNNLPESAEKVLDSIEQKAIKDKNPTQQLKTYLFRPSIFSKTIEEDPSQYSIKYLETKVGQLDAVHDAILHAELARSYFNYCVFHIGIFDFNPYNTPIEGDITKVNMKYWDKATFQTLIDRHFAEALKPVEALKKARTKDFVILYDNYPDSAQKNLMYEPSMYEFLLHCAAYCYSTRATNENINEERSTDSWWKPAAEFAKAELGDSDSP
jgi:hypothetical protein